MISKNSETIFIKAMIKVEKSKIILIMNEIMKGIFTKHSVPMWNVAL